MPASDAYRQEARRLRQRYAGRPEILHQHLRQLSRRYDQLNPAISPVEPVSVAPSFRSTLSHVTAVPLPHAPESAFARAVVDWFADQVAGRFVGRLLHHSQRRDLLQTAQRLGIDRFHANLIIAAAQHQADGRSDSLTPPPAHPARFSFAAILVLALAQTLILWTAWRIFHFQ